MVCILGDFALCEIQTLLQDSFQKSATLLISTLVVCLHCTKVLGFPMIVQVPEVDKCPALLTSGLVAPGP